MPLYFRIWIGHSYCNKRERTQPLCFVRFQKRIDLGEIRLCSLLSLVALHVLSVFVQKNTQKR
ncbi:hypothetical protein D8S93_05485 [Vibrio sp. VGrn 2]|uniref:DUF3265 domain-containing protein n=2 Tax=Vibrio TaxID=662 RepID=A0ABM6S811_9VIBR|nr:hypothetical protein AL468_03590 [Vibrio diabolicus]MDU9591794.1 hypothetical protein [Vibrio sp. 2-1-2a]MDU9602467.1 hypothetical protein [Vibrio sp. 1-2-3a]MPS38115.1 hypothetical protein [Vibrio sp. VGrn 2]NKJ66978.1 hypothetical protein [Vibrio chemaguriensis]NNN55232.1 hypothetical protein [Vibrio sp. 1-2 (7-a)]NNN78635.1 hypothetical protein [Vibrio sp. 11-4(1)]